MTVTLTFSAIIDMIMAADGIAAMLSTNANVAAINDDHCDVLIQLAKQAVAIVACEAGESVIDYSIDETGVEFELIDTVGKSIAESQLQTAMVWTTLRLVYAGVNAERAKTCAATASCATSRLAAYTAQCPANRQLSML